MLLRITIFVIFFCYSCQIFASNDDNPYQELFNKNRTFQLCPAFSYDSQDYKDFIQEFKKKKVITNEDNIELWNYAVSGEVSAFLTLMRNEISTPEGLTKFADSFFEKYSSSKKFTQQGFKDALEQGGVVYENAGVLCKKPHFIDKGFSCYEQAEQLGELTLDTTRNYLFALLTHRGSNFTSVQKAWLLLQKWQKQFKGNSAVYIITPFYMETDEKSRDLKLIYMKLFNLIVKNPSYYPLITEMLDLKDKKDTPNIISGCILENFTNQIEGTPLEKKVFQHSRFLMFDLREYESHFQKKLEAFVNEEIREKRALQNIIFKNLRKLLGENEELRNFARSLAGTEQVKDLSPLIYTKWAREIINSHREALLFYSGNHSGIIVARDQIDNVELEKILLDCLPNFYAQNYSNNIVRNIISNNIGVLFQENKELRVFPKEHFKEKFDITKITNRQYKKWAQEILKKKKILY